MKEQQLKFLLDLIRDTAIKLSKSKSRHKTLLKILLTLPTLSILSVILHKTMKEEVIRRLLLTISNISRVTRLSRNTVWRYMKDLESKGVVRKVGYYYRAGWVYTITLHSKEWSDKLISNSNTKGQSIIKIIELVRHVNEVARNDPEIKFFLNKFWLAVLKLVYEIIVGVYDVIKSESKYLARKLKLRDIMYRITLYINSLEEHKLDFTMLCSDLESLLIILKEYIVDHFNYPYIPSPEPGTN